MLTELDYQDPIQEPVPNGPQELCEGKTLRPEDVQDIGTHLRCRSAERVSSTGMYNSSRYNNSYASSRL